MTEYETEEQRVEAIRKWWAENGTSIILGAVLGIALLVGWRGWAYWKEKIAREASDHYARVAAALESGNLESAEREAGLLKVDYGSTPYAAIAALALARLEAARDRLDAAATELQWVLDNARQETARQVARLRLARVRTTQGRPDEALTLLTGLPEAYTALAEEARGDALRAKGDVDGARKAYDRALAASGRAGSYLQWKRDDLGDPPQVATD